MGLILKSEQMTYRRYLSLAIYLLLAIASYSIAPAVMGMYELPVKIYVATACMVVLVLGHQITGELFLIKFGPTAAIVVTEENKITFKDSRDQLDQCRRKTFKRRLNGVFMLLFSIPAAILSTWSFFEASNKDAFDDFCVVVTAWMLFSLLCIKITNGIAVHKFGAVEKEAQKLASQRIKERTKTKKRARLSKKQQIIFFVLGVTFGLLMLMISARFGIPKGLMKAITFSFIIGLSLFLKRNQKTESVDYSKD